MTRSLATLPLSIIKARADLKRKHLHTQAKRRVTLLNQRDSFSWPL